MASFSSIGIGAGMDTATMLEKIKAAEQIRLKPYTLMQNNYKSKISAWGTLSSSMSALQGSVKKLTNDAFNTLSVSTNKAFSAKAGTGADADTHAIHVEQLAVAHKLKTEAFDASDERLGAQNGATRTITITNGDGKTTTVTLADDETSLDQIAKAINKQDGGAKASVQRTTDGYQLVLSAKNTGTDGKMKVEVSGDTQLGDILNTSNGGKGSGEPDASLDKMSQVTAAQNAKLTVDGMDYERSSNNISDIISDVTLELKAKSETADPEQLTLTRDSSAIKTSVKDFVEKYNALLKLTTAASKYVPNETAGLKDEDIATQNGQNGALMGDSTLRGMVSELRSTVNGVYGENDADVRALADLGIKIDAASGQMTLNESKLDTAIADNPDAIADMFMGRGETEGLATKLSTIVEKYVGNPDTKTEGIIKTSTEGLDAQVKIMQTQLDKTQKLIDAQVERYKVQFQNLDSTMSKMNSLSNSMASMLASLNTRQ